MAYFTDFDVISALKSILFMHNVNRFNFIVREETRNVSRKLNLHGKKAASDLLKLIMNDNGISYDNFIKMTIDHGSFDNKYI